jgi:hypothetical protein
MPPEYLRDGLYTPVSDLYSLGLVFYELISGSPAVTGNSSAQVIASQLQMTSFVVPDDVHPGLRWIGNRLLRKRPEERFQSAAELIAAIDSVERASNVDRVDPVWAQQWTDEMTGSHATHVVRKKRQTLMMVIVFVVGVIVACIGILANRSADPAQALPLRTEGYAPSASVTMPTNTVAIEDSESLSEELQVTTQPAGGKIRIGDTDYGVAPVVISCENLQWPITLEVQYPNSETPFSVNVERCGVVAVAAPTPAVSEAKAKAQTRKRRPRSRDSRKERSTLQEEVKESRFYQVE